MPYPTVKRHPQHFVVMTNLAVLVLTTLLTAAQAQHICEMEAFPPPPTQQQTSPISTPTGTSFAGPPVIDILYAYTPEAKNIANGTILIKISEGIDNLNQAMRNSGINALFRLAGTYEVNYEAYGTASALTDVNRLQDPDDGYMDDIQIEADRVHADIVMLTLESISGGRVADIRSPDDVDFVTKAYGVVTVWDIGGYTFVHEVGHLMGVHHHDHLVSGTFFSSSFGYRFNTSEGLRQTLMCRTSEAWVPLFSNPAKFINNEPAGIPIGVPGFGRDASRTINHTATATALHRQAPDVDLDGIPDDWETTHGLDPNNPEDDVLNPDYDSYNNYEEYVYGQNPWTANPLQSTYETMDLTMWSGGIPTNIEMQKIDHYIWSGSFTVPTVYDMYFWLNANGTGGPVFGERDQLDVFLPVIGNVETNTEENVNSIFLESTSLEVGYPLRFVYNETTENYTIYPGTWGWNQFTSLNGSNGDAVTVEPTDGRDIITDISTIHISGTAFETPSVVGGRIFYSLDDGEVWHYQPLEMEQSFGNSERWGAAIGPFPEYTDVIFGVEIMDMHSGSHVFYDQDDDYFRIAVDREPPILDWIGDAQVEEAEGFCDVAFFHVQTFPEDAYENIILHYRINGGTWQTDPYFSGDDLVNGTFRATSRISGFQSGDVIEYRYIVIDLFDVEHPYPANGDTLTYTFIGHANQWLQEISPSWRYPEDEEIADSQDVYINIKTKPAGAAVNVKVVYSPGSWWGSVLMQFTETINDEDRWYVKMPGNIATGSDVHYAVVAADCEGTQLWDDNNGANYHYRIVPTPPLAWVGNGWQWPLHGDVDPADELWINVESYPKGSAQNAELYYNINNQNWQLASMLKGDGIGNNDNWYVNLGRFPAGTFIEYALVAYDHTTGLWDNNGGQNYGTFINPELPLQWYGDVSHYPVSGNIEPTDDVWINIQSWPQGSATSATVRYTTDNRQTWSAVPMNVELLGANDHWYVNLGSFSTETSIEYAIEIIDGLSQSHWDQNSGNNYHAHVN